MRQDRSYGHPSEGRVRRAAENGSPDVIEAPIKVYELLGAEVFLYAEVEGANLTASVEPETTAKVGDRIPFALDVNKIHVFVKRQSLQLQIRKFY